MDEIVAHAHARIEKGSKSFAAAARLFDAETRAGVYMLYSWCRHCDDEIDDQELGFARGAAPSTPAERLARIEERTRCALAGEASEPEFVALARVAGRYGIDPRLPFEHLAGFAMDAAGTHYATIDDTLRYCWHVAGVVGVMMARVMGAQGLQTLRRAADLGIAFQLTNIARDVMDDAASGRVYLPADRLAAQGIAPEAIADQANRAGVHRVTLGLLDIADGHYASAVHGLADLPPRAALAIGAARSIYRRIGRLVARRGPAAWDERAVVGKAGKLAALAGGSGAVVWARARRIACPPPPREGLWTPEFLKD